MSDSHSSDLLQNYLELRNTQKYYNNIWNRKTAIFANWSSVNAPPQAHKMTPESVRKLVIHAHLKDTSASAIAENLNTNLGTVRNQIERMMAQSGWETIKSNQIQI